MRRVLRAVVGAVGLVVAWGSGAARADEAAIPYCVDPDWAPYEVIDGQGRHQGIAADLLALATERAGVRLELVPTRDWKDRLAAMRDGRCAMLSFLNRTPERAQWLAFSEPLFSDPNVLVTRENHGFISDLAAEGAAAMVLPEGTSIEERVRRDYPDIRIITTPSEAEAFAMVSRGEADMTLRSLSVAVYTIRGQGWFNLKVAGQVPGYENQLRAAVRLEDAALLERLNAGIATLTRKERAEIANRHVAITIVTPPDYTLALQVAGVLAVVLLTSLFWAVRLRAANRRLEASEAQFRDLFRHAPVSVTVHDRDSGAIVEANALALRSFGVDRLEDLTEDAAWGKPPYSLAEARIWLRRTGEQGAQRFEWRSPNGAGGTAWKDVTLQEVVLKGRPRIVATAADITAHKEAQQALTEQGAALARSNAELEQFAYAASHDLRQPLRMITSYAALLERRLGGGATPEAVEFLGYVRDGALCMEQMLSSLLDYARVGHDGEPQEAVALRSLVEEALRYLTPVVEQTTATVLISGDWPTLPFSRNEGVRLFQNLIGNALKYRRADRLPEVRVNSARAAAGWRVTVTDNGQGFDPAQADRLFKVFQRLHASTGVDGTGVGLAICRKIVDRHGGAIAIVSDGPGLGARVTVDLPAPP